MRTDPTVPWWRAAVGSLIATGVVFGLGWTALLALMLWTPMRPPYEPIAVAAAFLFPVTVAAYGENVARRLGFPPNCRPVELGRPTPPDLVTGLAVVGGFIASVTRFTTRY